MREKATILRDKGHSYGMIKEELGVSISTMSYWFSKRKYTPSVEALDRIKRGSSAFGIRRHNERVVNTNKTINEAINEIGKLTKRDIWMLGLGIYIGEGAKSIESVRIINSDPAVIKFSIQWFKQACGLTIENLIVSLFLYPDIDEQEAINYWCEVTGLPIENFRKTQYDRRKDKKIKMKNKSKYGTIQIRVRANNDPKKGVQLFRRISGWTKGALDQV